MFLQVIGHLERKDFYANFYSFSLTSVEEFDKKSQQGFTVKIPLKIIEKLSLTVEECCCLVIGDFALGHWHKSR